MTSALRSAAELVPNLIPGQKDIMPEMTVNPKDKQHPSDKMLATTFQGTRSIKVLEVPKPQVTDLHDIVLKVTATAICGSDLHLYEGAMLRMQKGDVLGHEFMGIVEQVGPDVKSVKKGDRVVTAFDIACGSCSYCSDKLFSECDHTNPSEDMQKLYGDRISGFYGYSHLTGGIAGGQAEYVRVHHADVNVLKVPEGMTDMSVLLLSDILPTAWHSTEMAEVQKGDRVAIWGAGPVGILAAHCCQHRGASEIVIIDAVPFRLDFAKKHIPGIKTINFKEVDVFKTLKKMYEGGPNKSIEAVGFHYAKSMMHRFEMATGLETDPSDIVNEMINSTRKGGKISIVGVYSGFTNHFNLGALMEKNLTIRGGQTPVQAYWHYLLKCIQEGSLNAEFVITHKMALSEAAHGYDIFNKKVEDCLKVVLLPGQ